MSDLEFVNAPAPVRRARILELLAAGGFVKVTELSVVFGVSEVTIRSDLDALESAGQLDRVHGGAVTSATPRRTEPAFEEALGSLWDEKLRIAAHAAALVSPGDSVIIDVGTTAAALARALVDRADLHDVVIITNGLKIALELERALPRFSVIVTGGTLRALQHSLVNPMADGLFDSLHADIAFIGCNGVDVEHGITNINLPEAEIKRRMLGAATRRIVLADGSKIGQVHLGRVAPVGGVDSVITGHSARAAPLNELREAGLDVTRVDAGIDVAGIDVAGIER
ncbi:MULTISPECIES: DeoR/GlpR family DNA-binding transcription regulator [unclassified Agreia]|uniref:DeoR/GlpR family DNA-binding transcription regulator n=1 Tax=unclassified Agreia TaxID=2641148 RepID=UPI0006F1D407|nr:MULTISPECIES: DeoR/GlpR family DNA-binding transcription regulator [unclassified Agreia]KQM57081.1 DeoR family transcriptional regulator [Agreia sp. Leaf210]KQR22565.1 DeoR family transcriptional regulator [Agreia sp. Leaf335]